MLYLTFLFTILLTTSQPDTTERFELNKKKDETFTIELPSNPTTGYTWKLRPATDNAIPVVKLLKDLYQPHDQPGKGKDRKVGGGGVHTFTFVADKKGATNLEFIHVRPWEKDSSNAEPARIYHVEIK
ncbi:MAG: hypothetical protein EZS28_000604 [Streblomastix strix]|uniref:Proteinase inhibitor I42 chagasin domain-containing protein n=1 Tax=Streblomastix strix TaxID=222440 RepID=A0A5J4X9T1_9EUKA|nr:MAG: hypothetical protein EZS28_000604 [Streblomastix strix]